MSSGTSSLLSEVLKLGAVATALALGVAHFDSIRALIDQQAGTAVAATQTKDAAASAGERPTDGTVELRASDSGHYHAQAEVNGREIEVLVDTGATLVALTYEDAERAGIYLKRSDFTHTVGTANGVARVAPVMLDRVSIGDITVRNVQGVVSEEGRLQTSLLGMSFLSRLDRVDMRSGTLVLED